MARPLPAPCAVVSCHVERPLDDAVWEQFRALQERRPGGFTVAALVRPADAAFGEDEEEWAARAREAATRAPLGHHTHWTAPGHARPTADGASDRVRSEGARLRALGLAPSLFCGGGWYTDHAVADACAQLGYADCTPRATRPGYLAGEERWAELAEPARLGLGTGRSLLAIPTTHSLGDLVRALAARSLPRIVHVYFHDTDLLDRRRRVMVAVLLRALALRREPSDLDALAGALRESAPPVRWEVVARGGP